LWLGDERNRLEKEASRTAATIRDHEIQIKVDPHKVSHRAGLIKPSLTPDSRRNRGARTDRRDVSASLQDQSIGHRRLRPFGARTIRARRAHEPAEARTLSSSMSLDAPSRRRRTDAVAQRPSPHWTNLARERP
jgi:hypothetical protein